jgi:hypothetical protein
MTRMEVVASALWIQSKNSSIRWGRCRVCEASNLKTRSRTRKVNNIEYRNSRPIKASEIY